MKRKLLRVAVVAALAASGAFAAGEAPHGTTDLGSVHRGIAKSVDAGAIQVAKAEGPTGRTVAEVNAERAALKDKTVTIRAKIVKVTSNVMGKNWVHLRDGTGSAADSNNDLVATSGEEPTVGDIVVAKGVVRTDVNIGSGYAYKVLLENASFQR